MTYSFVKRVTVKLAFMINVDRSISFQSMNTGAPGTQISNVAKSPVAYLTRSNYPWVTNYCNTKSSLLQAVIIEEDFAPFTTIEGGGSMYRDKENSPGGATTFESASLPAINALIAAASRPPSPMQQGLTIPLRLPEGTDACSGVTIPPSTMANWNVSNFATAKINEMLAAEADNYPAYTMDEISEEVIVPAQTGGGTPFSFGVKTFVYKLSHGRNVVAIDYPLYIFKDNDGFYVVESLDGVYAADAPYEVARRTYDAALKKQLARAAQGLTPVIPADANPVDMDAVPVCLRDEYGKWWENAKSLRDSLAKAEIPSDSEAYSKYVASGGMDEYETWKSGRESRANAASTTNSSGAFGSALGWTADKISDGLAWLGNSALDLMKSWGPMGTVGAFAGFKAVNSVSNKWLPWIVGGGALLLLTR